MASNLNNAAAQPEMRELIVGMATRARLAQTGLALLTRETKAKGLLAAADNIEAQADKVLAANKLDYARAEAGGLSSALLDRLRLDVGRLAAIAAAVRSVAMLEDPVGQTIDTSTRPNGMVLSRVRVPIGLLGIIYESRPNVTVDAAALCVMSGNAAILRGGSEAVSSNKALYTAFAEGLAKAGLPRDVVQLVPTQDRDAVGAMLSAAGQIDMIIPRGGKGLVSRVQDDARVPVLAHLDGICHSYIHAEADPVMASEIALNAKMRRTGICGAMETLLIDAKFPDTPKLLGQLLEAGCELRGDPRCTALDPRIGAATAEDWDTEYLEPILAVKIVDGLDDALSHIAAHSSGHTDAIVTADHGVAEQFMAQVDSAIVMHNVSSQFADGGEFGLGAEIGIATGRLHARGPVALEGLTTYKWQVRGTGQVRPQ